MRIAICTPWSRRSAVARSSRALAEALSTRAEVVVLYPDVDDPLAASIPTMPGLHARTHAGLLRSCDHVLHVMGDHPWHEGVRQTANAHPGVVVLHDLSLANLAWSYATRSQGPEGWLRLAEAWHGPAMALHARAILDQTPHWEQRPVDPAALHFRRWAMRGCTGVLVHSRWAAAAVAADLPASVPVAAVPLAYPFVFSGPRRDRSHDLVVVVGSLHPDRQGELIIDAVAAVARRAEVTACFVGPGEPARVRALADRAEAAGVTNRVSFLGELDDRGFRSMVADAAVAVNLRRPVLQTGSATVLEQMAAGSAVVVLDEGPFAELPDDAVVKVARLDARSVASRVLHLLADPAARARVGDAAARHVALHHQPAAVAAAVLAHLDTVETGRPIRELGEQLATMLRPLVVTAADPLARRVAAHADGLFANTFDGPPVPIPVPRSGAT